jgi:hypothetical protein
VSEFALRMMAGIWSGVGDWVVLEDAREAVGEAEETGEAGEETEKLQENWKSKRIWRRSWRNSRGS